MQHRQAPTSLSFFSTCPRRFGKDGNNSSNNNPGQLPKFSMKDLQASPTVKVVVYTMIGIIATAETYTYGLWAWNRWFREEEKKKGVGEGGEV